VIETEQKQQRVWLIGADTGAYDAEESIAELAELAESAGAEVIGDTLQHMEKINNATYIGGGKLREVKSICADQQVDLVIFDDELSGSQIRNIEELLGVDVIDRTMLILDIFAARARSNEGKLQVELAQQKYLLPRLIGMGNQLSRQGGGIGTRGPGESKLESDRRHIRRRIEALELQLAELAVRRGRIRSRREKNSVKTVALVGYTNVGKSTLLNRLTEAGVFAKDQLFATLDPTARELVLPNGQHVILVDTVGLIRRLPHQLIEAFRSTLEEAAEADVIVNLCDIASGEADEQLRVTRRLLEELGASDIPVITGYNKADLLEGNPEMLPGKRNVLLSAKTGEGIDDLLAAIEQVLAETVCRMKLCIPYADAGMLDLIRREGKLLREEYTPEGILAEAVLDRKYAGRYTAYLQ
jgi:GTP-binding protein HflX